MCRVPSYGSDCRQANVGITGDRAAPAPAPPLLPPLQNDVLLETATVREAVATSALLRLPAKMPRAAKAARAEAVLVNSATAYDWPEPADCRGNDDGVYLRLDIPAMGGLQMGEKQHEDLLFCW